MDLFYVHTDHLNTPRKITRPSDNALMWTYNSDPFGNGAPNENPSGLGTFGYNLRFPGQYYDSESGLNYNYFRDYDSATGRYVESDPMGLRAGVNTYAYVKSNPISLDDPYGLKDRAEPQPCILCWPFAPPTTRPPGGWWEEEFAKDVWDGAKQIAKKVKNFCSSEESDEDREKRCQENLDRDLATCAALSKRDGKSAYKICEAQAMLRYSNCLSGRDEGIKAPLPPWGTK